jgi:gliding motility-associated-like protein
VDAGPDQWLELATSTTLQGTADAGSLQWSVVTGGSVIHLPGEATTAVDHLSIGLNTFVLTATINGCASSSDTVLVHVADLFIPQGFSPNGDGVNDRFEITGLARFAEARLEVFDRWGRQVLKAERYVNDWAGMADNGAALPDDTYFYVLNLGPDLTYNGHIIIKR